MIVKFIKVLLFCLSSFGFSQSISGIVLDANTQEPIESAVVYFDNTTKGTITNSKGHFSIDYTEATQSPLVISFLGYQKQLIRDYRSRESLTIQLKESHEVLDEVLISTTDGLTRKEKLNIFKREFLGTSRLGKSCQILNEDALILKYLKKERKLIAHSSVPLKIKNRALQYEVTYELSSFWATFSNEVPQRNNFEVNVVGFRGNPFYQNLTNFDEKKARKNREKAFKGSTLQFMRTLYAGKLDKVGFKMYQKRKNVAPKDVFNIDFYNNTSIKKVSLEKEEFVTVVYKNKQVSGIHIAAPYFLVDSYGNYTEVHNIKFSGYIGGKRFGDLLPLDYGL